MLSCIYLTRACPNSCIYCAIRNSPLQGPELTLEQWRRAFDILKDLGVDFHLLLGNELLMRDDIVEIMDYLTNVIQTPYAFYTTCPPYLMKKHAQNLVDIGLTNASSGMDIIDPKANVDLSVKQKSIHGFLGLRWFKKHGVPDLQGNITASSISIEELPNTIRIITDEGYWSGMNTIHWNRDGRYDFFPPVDAIQDLLITQDQIDKCADVLSEMLLRHEIALMNPPEYLEAWRQFGANINWHCTQPLIYTVDADGTMRCCGYRKGFYSPKISIFDLETHNGVYRFWDAWKKDQKECPGCFWSYPWLSEFFLTKEDYDFGMKVFQVHASRYFNFGGQE